MKVIYNENAEVGENPIWDIRDQCCYFIDIRGKCVFKEDGHEGFKRIDLPQQIGCMAICENGDLLVALEDAVYRMNKSGDLTKAYQDIEIKGRRFNDGKVGPDGAFSVGTTDDNGNGAFYRLRGGELTELFCGCACSNGIDWTRDGKTMYYIDSPKQMVEAFDFDTERGELSNIGVKRNVEVSAALEIRLKSSRFGKDVRYRRALGRCFKIVFGSRNYEKIAIVGHSLC